MVEFVDLNQSDQRTTEVRCDVCIIGGGAAGLYLANRLATHELKVVVLEAGGERCQHGAALDIQPQFSAQIYAGAHEGRAFGWGGTTSRWGGLLVPHSRFDIPADGDATALTWRHIVEVVQRRQSSVYQAIGLGAPNFFTLQQPSSAAAIHSLRREGIETVTCDFLPFWRRRLSFLLSNSTRAEIKVYLNAVASGWSVTAARYGNALLTRVEARSLSGRSIGITAKAFTIAAGALESARILLELDRSSGSNLVQSSAVGHYLSDHLSASIAEVHREDRLLAARLFGPIFRRGRMRAFRFIDNSSCARSRRHFAHLIFEIDTAAFSAAKKLLYGLQSKDAAPCTPKQLLRAVGGASNMLTSYLLKRRLFIPSGTACHLQLDVEQQPRRDNRISLGNQIDRYGRPVAVINWSIDERDRERVEAQAATTIEKWSRAQGLPRLVAINSDVHATKLYDAYHPVGTCRMGDDAQAAVDLSLRVRGSQNLYVLSTGVLPSAGTANPTFTMLCLGDVLAERLLSHRQSGQPEVRH